MSQNKPQNIPSSPKPMIDQKTPKQTAAAKNAGASQEQPKNKNPQTSKNHSSQK